MTPRLQAIQRRLHIIRWLRSSEAAMILIAIAMGAVTGLVTALQSWLAHGLQHVLYGVGINRLSALGSIRHSWRLLALPLGGAVLALVSRRLRSPRGPIDVVEANALHGGRVPLYDTLQVCAQTLLSNGFGASVGLEAAYAQAGGCLASQAGRWLGLRRADMRILVGAGAGAAIGAAFGAPLTGAFYGFEIVIGAYTPAAIAPVAAAALAARLVTTALGVEPWLIATSTGLGIGTVTYLLAALLGLVAAIVGIAIMKAQAHVERAVARLLPTSGWRPILGGALLMPIAWISPQALSAGHGAMHLDMVLHPAVTFLVVVFALKVLASIISLSFGFRGGLFFASLFLGSLLGPIYAAGLNLACTALGTGPLLDEQAAALIGMAAMAVTIIGAPMALSLLTLEVTHDFALTGVVVTACLCAGAFTRATFGYSFSTWRLHLRGTAIRGPRDIAWAHMLTAGRMMRQSPPTLASSLTVAEFRHAAPLGSTSRVVLVDQNGHYAGVVTTAEAHEPQLDGASPVAALARLRNQTLHAEDGIESILDRFDKLQVDDIAVTDAQGSVIGLLTDKYVRRRYAEELEKSQRSLYGEPERGAA